MAWNDYVKKLSELDNQEAKTALQNYYDFNSGLLQFFKAIDNQVKTGLNSSAINPTSVELIQSQVESIKPALSKLKFEISTFDDNKLSEVHKDEINKTIGYIKGSMETGTVNHISEQFFALLKENETTFANEQKQKAKAEAERIAKAERERKEREEAERKAQEEKARREREEKERITREEAERKAKEERERKRQEEIRLQEEEAKKRRQKEEERRKQKEEEERRRRQREEERKKQQEKEERRRQQNEEEKSRRINRNFAIGISMAVLVSWIAIAGSGWTISFVAAIGVFVLLGFWHKFNDDNHKVAPQYIKGIIWAIGIIFFVLFFIIFFSFHSWWSLFSILLLPLAFFIISELQYSFVN
jgi:hypothetical protein